LEEERARRFAALVATHFDAAYNLAFWLTRTPQIAEDCVQAACLRALKEFERFHGGDGRIWLLRIVRSTCYGWRVKENFAALGEFDLAGAATQPEESTALPIEDEDAERIVLDETQLRHVETAMLALPPELREALVLRELEELAYRDIAEVLDIPIGTVMSRLSRGRKLLREQLSAMGEAAGVGSMAGVA
jgi:RNA polymerase sigma-70 factor (ECF subfamily)